MSSCRQGKDMVWVCLMLSWLQGQRRSNRVNTAGGAEQGNLGVIRAQARCNRGVGAQRGKCRRCSRDWAQSAAVEAFRRNKQGRRLSAGQGRRFGAGEQGCWRSAKARTRLGFRTHIGIGVKKIRENAENNTPSCTVFFFDALSFSLQTFNAVAVSELLFCSHQWRRYQCLQQ
ncbi:hypothetical protein SLEP1_g23503 [Rubroshorea leprosula]|uniref:Secreted protein n=1 Tax=Rubroshorea leprosula TaxID=152421 RepID=A0AAV5JLW2_9ROSI|nr:hypothetical protein SLEP1_g23503 [Rubroshorea leprosula]